jgi:hypothetical protein
MSTREIRRLCLQEFTAEPEEGRAQCTCAECRSGDRMPKRLQGISGAVQLRLLDA